MSTLLWGLDKDYYSNKEWIEKNYNITAYYDTNANKVAEGQRISKDELEERIQEFDRILVAADPPSIVSDLVDNYHVSFDKIDVLFYELTKMQSTEITFYGENLEDAVLLLLIKRLNISINNIHYLEIGTNDPVRHNNSFLLYSLGARGVLVDAFPTVGKLAGRIRPGDRFLNYAVSDKSGGNVVFYACESSAYSSLDSDYHTQYENKRLNGVKEISVPMVGINDLIKQCGFMPNVILCDAEGFDEIIIKGIDYDNCKPAIIMLETDHMDSEEGSVKAFMEKKGFKLFARVKQNDIYYNTRY